MGKLHWRSQSSKWVKTIDRRLNWYPSKQWLQKYHFEIQYHHKLTFIVLSFDNSIYLSVVTNNRKVFRLCLQGGSLGWWVENESLLREGWIDVRIFNAQNNCIMNNVVSYSVIIIKRSLGMLHKSPLLLWLHSNISCGIKHRDWMFNRCIGWLIPTYFWPITHLK